MAINKVIFGNQTLMDTTGVTVTPNNITRGTTALAANGETITGVLDTAPLYNDLDKTSEGYALDARQGKALNDKIIGLGNPVTITHGGTGAATASGARTNLNVYSKDEIEEKISLSSTVGPTNIASIDDGLEINAKDLEINIEPVQDLHGYENPWPAGGGKNKLQVTESTSTVNAVIFTINDDGTVYVSGATSSDYSLKVLNGSGISLPIGDYILSGCPSGGEENVYVLVLLRYKENGEYSGSVYVDKGNGVQFSVTDPTDKYVARVQIYSAAGAVNLTFKPMVCLTSATNPTTFSPYSNICPISGWTGANVTRTGKNLLNIFAYTFYKYENGVTFTINSDGSITANGTASNLSQILFSIPRKDASQLSGMILNGCPLLSGCEIRIEQQTSPWRTVASDTGNGGTIADTIKYVGSCYILFRVAAGTTVNNVVFKPMIRAASVADGTFEPYVGTTYPISWQSEAGTVYGGTLDVTTGLLTVTMAEVDLGTLTWVKGNRNIDDTGYVFSSSSITGTAKANENIICSSLIPLIPRVGTWERVPANHIEIDAYKYLIVSAEYPDAASFKAAMSGVQLVYELATPQTYQLTPVEIEMLLGDNNVWADTGDITITYRKNDSAGVNREILNLAQNIQKINKPTYTDMVADSQIASNKYFIIGNNLYLSTTAISTGSAIIPGTNCVLTNLAEALNAINT